MQFFSQTSKKGVLVGSLVLAAVALNGCGTDPLLQNPTDTLPSTVVSPVADDYKITASEDGGSGAWKFAVQEKRPSTVSTLLSWVWDFGDGQTYTGTTRSYSFSEPGWHTITVRAYDSQRVEVFLLTLDLEIPAFNEPPITVAQSQTVWESTIVYLDGSATNDPAGDELTYEWIQISGPPVLLENVTLPVARFVAPMVEIDTRLVFTLTVSDGVHSSETTVTVDVLNVSGLTPDSGPSCRFSVTLDEVGGLPNANGLRPLTLLCSASTTRLDASVGAELAWSFDGIIERGALSTHTITTPVFYTGGIHTIALSLIVAGVPIACQNTDDLQHQATAIVWPTVSGRVVDETGKPLSGIVVAGNANATTAITDSGGYYKIHVPFDWSGVVTPIDSRFMFSPAREVFEGVQSDLSSPDLIGLTDSAPVETICNVDADCDDGYYCNGYEGCVSGKCQAGAPPCSGPGVACDEELDRCELCQSNGDCDDGVFCNGVESCVNRICQPGEPVNCDDGVSCTDDSCNEPSDSCSNVPNDSLCDNALFCDGTEVCDPVLGCLVGSDPCLGEICDETLDRCGLDVPGAGLLAEDFDAYGAGADPVNWIYTGAANSLQEDPTLFSVLSTGGSNVFGTDSDETNIHAHYIGAGSQGWSDYTFTGSMRIADPGGGIGVTFLSNYSTSDAYYRLRRHAGDAAFHISPHGTSISGGTTNTGVVPQVNTWYQFKIEVEDAGGRTNIRAKVWSDGSTEPSTWQIDCYDNNPTRRTTGTVGVWSMGPFEKHWDNFTAQLKNCDVDSDGDGTVDCNDDCPTDPAKILAGVCGCGLSDQTDSDGDSVPDCVDQCPGGPDNADSDGDGVADFCDVCPLAPDVDSDGDGTMDCNDRCPNDANKTEAGICGCGVADVDSDGDGALDCNDDCPSDPNKTSPGVCGCNKPDVDENGNPITDPANCPAGQTTRSITQWGITWTFDREYEYGQFVNGDYWVVAPVTVVSITKPHSDAGLDGSMVNPITSGAQGYDAQLPSYSSALNVSLALPLTLGPSTSLVSTIVWIPSDPGSPPFNTTLNVPRPAIRTAAILTALATAPPEGAFRPAYAGTDKTLYSSLNLRTDLLLSLTPAGSPPTLSSVERKFERVWLEHYIDWKSDYTHPSENMNNYGAEIVRDVGEGALRLLLSDSLSAKQTLLIRYVQLGIDFHGMVLTGHYWLAGGGHASGRKFPILFAGLMLNDAPMMDIGTYPFVIPGYSIPQAFLEDCQTYYDDDPAYQFYYGILGYPRWGDAHCRYINTRDRNTEEGFDARYRSCCTSQAWVGQTLAARLLGLEELWNHQPYFDYVDRWMEETNGGEGISAYRSSWADAMWDRYRSSIDTCVNNVEDRCSVSCDGTAFLGENGIDTGGDCPP